MGGRAIWILLIIAASLGYSASAQQYAFRITFSDKNNTPYSFSDSLAYLSDRALQRRARQHIAIDSTDLPVDPAYVDSVLTLTGGIFHETSRWLNTCILLLEESDSAQILNLAGKSYISNIKLAGAYNTDLHHRNSAPQAAGNTHKTTATDNTYYSSTWTQTALVHGNYLHDNGYDGQGMLIAVMDAGFTYTNTHPGFDSLWQSGRLVDTFNLFTTIQMYSLRIIMVLRYYLRWQAMYRVLL